MYSFSTIDTIGVVGAGTMGHGIAQACGTAGYAVTMSDVDVEAVDRGMAAIDESLERLAADGRLAAASPQAVRERITPTTELSDLADCELVSEAVIEAIDVKRDVFTELDGLVDERPSSRPTPARSRSPRSPPPPTALNRWSASTL